MADHLHVTGGGAQAFSTHRNASGATVPLTSTETNRGMFQIRSTVVIFLVLLPGLSPGARAQAFKFSGFVKTEYIHDTRQVAGVREGQFALYPLADAEASRTDNVLFAAFQSRAAVTASGAEALGARLTATLEGDFFGASNANISTLMLRHAFVRLDWGLHELLLGQYWSPLFGPAVFPQVAGSSTGAPFQPFARFPQASYAWKPDPLRVTATLSQQRDAFAEIGGNKLQQQAALPGAHLHVDLLPEDGSVLGAGGYAKAIRPELAGERFGAWTLVGYGRLNRPGFALAARLTYGRDLADHLMPGGFVTDGNGSHAPLRLVAGWIDVSTRRDPFSAGLFGGFLENLGAADEIAVATRNARDPALKYVWRVAPRIGFRQGPLSASIELEATTALYGGGRFDARYRPVIEEQDEPVTNLRTLLVVMYFF
jgi:hypothetical protein